MPSQDFELQVRKDRRDHAHRALEDARRELESAKSNREYVQSAYGPKYEYLKGAIPDHKENMKQAFQEASSAWDSGDKSGAKDWSDRGKELKAELRGMYDEKEDALTHLKEAGEQFRQALTTFHERKAEFEAARDAVNERYTELKEENERRRLEREAERQRREQERASRAFGTGNEDSTYERKNFTAPVHGVTSDGRPVTAAFGKGKHEGETLIKRGHARGPKQFYGTRDRKLHDHFDKHGNAGKSGDRGMSE